MATRAACANSSWTTSTTWATIDSTSFSNSESANTALTTSYVSSSTFTPGAITIDGIAVKIASRAASPTGTMSINLRNTTDGTDIISVTVNVSDIPTATATTGTTTPVGTAEGGWFFLKFASTLLVAGKAYAVQGKTSSSSQVNLWSSATTNWSRYLRTTTTGSMSSGDDAIITGEWTAAATVTTRTVTMDETATTDYGGNTTSQVTPSLAICNNGTLTFSTGIAANLRQSGYVVVYNGGTLNVGTSGSPVDRAHTAVLQFDCASDGDFGLVARIGATVNFYGQSRTIGKNVSQTKLNANAASSATSITIVDDTGWLSGDVVCLAPTTQTASQFESKALTGNATATTAAITALTNAHSGTSPTQAEVGLLTRNVQLTAVTANVVTFLYVATTATVTLGWTDFRYVGTNTGGKRGIEINTTTGSFSMDYCTVRDTDCGWLYMTGGAFSNVTVTNSIFYNCFVAAAGNGGINVATATSGTWTLNNNMFCGATSSGAFLLSLADVGGTLTNCSISGSTAIGIVLNETAGVFSNWSGLQIHSNGSSGVTVTSNSSGTFSSGAMWRNATSGITNTAGQVTGTQLIFDTMNLFGNARNFIGSAFMHDVSFLGCTLAGDTTFTSACNIELVSSWGGVIRLNACSLSPVSGIYTRATNDFEFSLTGGNFAGGQVIGDNSIFNGTGLYNTGVVAGVPSIPVFKFQNYGQVSNDNRSYYINGAATFGVIQSNSSTVYSPNVLSEQMTPSSATVKLVSQSIFVECASGKAATPIVQVRKDGTYNGNAPRLIVKRQDSMGVTVDTVLQTFSASANTWQALTGTTVVASQTGVFEFVVDCDGTAGSAFVGDATASTA